MNDILDSCTVTNKTRHGSVETVAGRVWFNNGLSSVVLTRQECREWDATSQGPDGDHPIVLDDDRGPSSAPEISSAVSSTSSTSSNTSSPASVGSGSLNAISSAGVEETGSPAPTTVQNKPPKPTAADQNWKSTVCFQGDTAANANKAVLSYKVAQDNIHWIANNVGKVSRNSGVNNCTRLACHRNSAIWFCNDVGDLSRARSATLTM